MFRGPARNWPLAARLTATVTALLTFAVVLMTAVSVQQETAELREELTSQADLILSVLTEIWLDPIIKLDVDVISDAMVGLENSDRVLNIHVYDPEGRLIADIADEPGGPPRDRSAFEADDAGLDFVSAAETITRWEDDRLIMGRPVGIGRQVFGVIEISSRLLSWGRSLRPHSGAGSWSGWR